MEFFIPHADSDEQRDRVWDGIKKNAKRVLSWNITNAKIYRLEFTHNSQEYTAEVGKYCKLLDEETLTILETDNNCYLICTQYRGYEGGEPAIVGVLDTKKMVLFDE